MATTGHTLPRQVHTPAITERVMHLGKKVAISSTMTAVAIKFFMRLTLATALKAGFTASLILTAINGVSHYVASVIPHWILRQVFLVAVPLLFGYPLVQNALFQLAIPTSYSRLVISLLFSNYILEPLFLNPRALARKVEFVGTGIEFVGTAIRTFGEWISDNIPEERAPYRG